MSDEIHVGDIGTIFEVTVLDGTSPLDISDASERKIFIQRPDGTVLDEDADFTTDGSDGKMQYQTTGATEINMPGTWRIQGKVIVAAGTFYTDVGKFLVEGSLGE